jgi:hypothetical protein
VSLVVASRIVAVIARKHPRFAVQLPVGFTGDQHEGWGTILNISVEGCMITAETAVPSPSYLHVSMHLRQGEPPIQVSLAAVRWVAKNRFGVEYIKVEAGEMERLEAFVAMLDSPSARL